MAVAGITRLAVAGIPRLAVAGIPRLEVDGWRYGTLGIDGAVKFEN